MITRHSFPLFFFFLSFEYKSFAHTAENKNSLLDDKIEYEKPFKPRKAQHIVNKQKWYIYTCTFWNYAYVRNGIRNERERNTEKAEIEWKIEGKREKKLGTKQKKNIMSRLH